MVIPTAREPIGSAPRLCHVIPMQLVIGLAILKVKGRRASAKGVAERNQSVPYNLTITFKESAGQSIEKRS